MLSVSRKRNLPSSVVRRVWPLALLLAASVMGIAVQVNIIVAGPATMASMSPPWLARLLLSLLVVSFWWAVYLWLLVRLGGLDLRDGLNRSVVPMAALSISLLPDLAVFLAGKLPFPVVFDGNLRSLYIWIVGLLVVVAFVGQELVLVGAVQQKSLGELAVAVRHRLSAFRLWIRHLPGLTATQIRRHPLLAAILVAGLAQRWVGIDDYHRPDMNDTLSVVYTILSWPPFRYYHDYNPQTYIFAHLPLFPILIAPFYWFFENVARLPTPWAAMLVSAVADLGAAALIYSQAKGRWKGIWGLLLAAAWMLSPLVAGSDDHPVGLAAAFTLAAFASLERGWLCGIMIGLAVASRTEAVFLALPVAIHFIAKRTLRETVGFLGALLTTLAAIATPFVLTDPAAIDFAMRLQGQRQAAGEISYLQYLLQPYLTSGLESLFLRNPSLLASVVILLAALLATRDARAARVALVVALGYVLTIPVAHARYMVFFYAAGLFYAARYGNPLVAVATVLASWSGLVENVAPWPGPIWALVAQVALAVTLAAFSLLRPDRSKNGGVRELVGSG